MKFCLEVCSEFFDWIHIKRIHWPIHYRKIVLYHRICKELFRYFRGMRPSIVLLKYCTRNIVCMKRIKKRKEFVLKDGNINIRIDHSVKKCNRAKFIVTKAFPYHLRYPSISCFAMYVL